MSLNLKERYGLLINNEWVPASDNAEFLVYNPANGEQLSICAEATYDDVDRAVQVANEAFKTWRHTSQIERADLLLKIADAIEARKEHFAKVETYDNGKPIRETLNVDVPLAVDHFRYFAGVLRAEEGSAQVFDENTLSLILREPIGVVGQVVPWNFPFLMAAWKLAPALAAGCTVVIKPSSHTSLSLLELGDILKDILPPGVVNIITGKGSKSGQYILDHPGFSKLAFTGSTEVGLDVYKAASERLIPATLELGGKSANIFFDDANWKQALDGAMLGILFNQGQVCCAGSRIFVQDTIYDTFVEELAALFDKVQVGLPWDENTQLGSLIYEGQVQKVLEYVDIAKQEGATIVAGGVRVTDGELGKGCFVRPTLIANATNDMRVAREEIFGPVAVVIKFHSEDEVIAAANDSLYGLGGGVWTQNINRAIRVARAIETGRMWVNTYNSIPAGAPFGGYKQSGIGRETHKVILEHYTQMKNIIVNLSDKPSGFYNLD
ncbi:aldehyde dehydrogenase family protein [Veillonella caviae]|uniref:aldehyde dehydrogenase family protein n=2 Tax=Veillonella caviae TaxID=248316 RepID=UPI0023F37172|nr:aldehyde dehydrogenase family protein [Veillonella caviae]MCI6407360.1 aldehyde dehydrogenase family protein [Veillonella caviae]MCI7694321.1 aldehyde dehydrogenase family protein [Veillonella caviae]MDD7291517.1 aldehyde dehydrogenase family protein [Veillonella caviae]MDY5253123.1 aldehyde dehydrogenase family protein [Veillonella caviae]MDY5786990.1 aldehyde dehydrogenase family protein [Veillonella caviae]